MGLVEHEVLSKSEGNRRPWLGKTEKSPSRLGRRSRLAAAADGGRVARKEKYSSERDQPAAEPPIVTTVWGTELGTSLPIGLPQHH